MRVFTKIIVLIDTDEVLASECFEHFGPLAECISFGGSKSKSKSSQTSESGVKYNEDFLNKATNWAGQGNFDAAAYLRDNPDVAGDPYWSQRPFEHYTELGRSWGRPFTAGKGDGFMPGYNPTYVRVAPEGFQKLEDTAFESQRSKLARAHEAGVARQREELAQMGALNSPSQFLEGSARSSLDRSYMDSLQQAARDAFNTRIGLEEREAARETGFNERTAAGILDLWLKKIGIAAQTGAYSRGEGSSSGSGSGFNFGLFNFGGSQNSNASTS